MALTIREALKLGRERLGAGTETPGLESEVLLGFVLKINRTELFLAYDQELSAGQCAQFENLLGRRQKDEPIAYLIQHQEFFNLDFYVDARVLIPRPETELLVEKTIRFITSNLKNQPVQILEVGTGSGCIAVALAKNLDQAQIWAVDISPEALQVAAQNIKSHQVEDKICLGQSDLLNQVVLPASLKPWVLIANLPYVETDYHLPPAVRYEPKQALFSGEKGLDHYQRLLKQSAKLNLRGIFLEIDPRQVNDLTSLSQKLFPGGAIEINQDLAGFQRVFSIQQSQLES
jgi:release factor glutamine methyltransferase